MWKNKHVVVAMLVAPALALIAYFATDFLVAERPQAAEPGASYPLVAKSNCRYASGECDLVNGDVRITLTAERGAAPGTVLQLQSALALRQAKASLAGSSGEQTSPVALVANDEGARSWSARLDELDADEANLLLVVTAGESHYYAEVPTVFFERETTGTR